MSIYLLPRSPTAAVSQYASANHTDFAILGAEREGVWTPRPPSVPAHTYYESATRCEDGFLQLPRVTRETTPATRIFVPQAIFWDQEPCKVQFSRSFFSKWPFLHYDEAQDVVFCHTCIKAFRQKKILFSHNAATAFVSLLWYIAGTWSYIYYAYSDRAGSVCICIGSGCPCAFVHYWLLEYWHIIASSLHSLVVSLYRLYPSLCYTMSYCLSFTCFAWPFDCETFFLSLI